ncbi:MAG: phenylalanine--tRNA ligase subunit beta [Verrucomicrobia bacterium]|nr:phenylalanine--tRNA ligase subunit beta [Verrucomicrobiota bacterium]
MKVSLRWLQEFLPFTGPVEELIEAMTASGMEVGAVERRGAPVDRVIVARIEAFSPHPNADRLSVCRVDDGSGQPRQIVCGAKNFRAGDKVPLALPGAVLPGGLTIKVSKLRGVESEGMLCSAKELNLAEDSAGLLLLPPDAAVGEPISALYPPDVIFDLELTPDRPDLLSYVGIARELAAILDLTANLPVLETAAELRTGAQAAVSEPEGCPYVVFRRFRNIQVKPSPGWMRERLEASGLRSINNLVDITNYVMLELGKPIHVYDAAKVRGGFRVRRARLGETLLALDGKDYSLTDQHLVIADEEGVLGLAGVMGGEESGVGPHTTEVWLESAYFDPGWIRTMSRGLGLISDASFRFERGVDPAAVVGGALRASELIRELAGAEADDVLWVAGEEPRAAGPITLRPDRCARLLGQEVPNAAELLQRIGVKPLGADRWQPPSYRPDLTREVDLIEEVCRLAGVDRIESRVMSHATPSSAADHAHDEAMALRRRLVRLGLYEARSLTLTDDGALAETLSADAPVWRLKNPLAEDMRVLRPSLVPGLLRAARRNFQRSAQSVALFELGRVFRQDPEAEELTCVGALLAGERDAKRWDQEARGFDFYDLKRVVETVAGERAMLERVEPNALAGLLCRVRAGNGEPVGWCGQVRPSVASKLDVRGGLFVAELVFRPGRQTRAFVFRPLDRFPAITRDIAFLAPLELKYGTVQQTLREQHEPLLAGFELFDLFIDPTGTRIPANRKSVALSLTYRAPDRTLTQDEVAEVHQRVRNRLVDRLAVTIREQ